MGFTLYCAGRMKGERRRVRLCRMYGLSFGVASTCTCTGVRKGVWAIRYWTSCGKPDRPWHEVRSMKFHCYSGSHWRHSGPAKFEFLKFEFLE